MGFCTNSRRFFAFFPGFSFCKKNCKTSFFFASPVLYWFRSGGAAPPHKKQRKGYSPMKAKAQEVLLLILGTALVALGVYFFKFPNNYSTGGVTGIAVILYSLFPSVSSSTFT